MLDCYQALQVPPDADHQTIDAAYWRLARESRALGEMAPQALAALNEAYEILGNHVLRQCYDASRAEDTARGSGPEEEVARSSDGAPQPPEPASDAQPAAPADEPPPALSAEEVFVDLLQTQVRQVRERMRARAASLEAPEDPAAESPIGRAFGRLPHS